MLTPDTQSRRIANLENLVLASLRRFGPRMSGETIAAIGEIVGPELTTAALVRFAARRILENARAERALEGGDLLAILDRTGQTFTDQVAAACGNLVRDEEGDKALDPVEEDEDEEAECMEDPLCYCNACRRQREND